MKNKRKRIPANTLLKNETSTSKPEKLKTDEPLSEKDEVKQAEERQRKHLEENNS